MNVRSSLWLVALAFVLGGCSSIPEISVADFNPLKGSDPLRSADYNYFYKRDQTAVGFVSGADLVGPDGRCAFDSAPRVAPGAGEAVAACTSQAGSGSRTSRGWNRRCLHRIRPAPDASRISVLASGATTSTTAPASSRAGMRRVATAPPPTTSTRRPASRSVAGYPGVSATVASFSGGRVDA